MYKDTVFSKTVTLNPMGMLSSFKIPPFQSGTLVYFDFGTKATDTLDIFPCFNKSLAEKPFQNGTSINTPICGLERIRPSQHQSSVIVIDRANFTISGMAPQIPNITLPYKDYLIVAKFKSSLSAEICCKDPQLLAQRHLNGLQNPETTVRNSLEAHFSAISEQVFLEKLNQQAIFPYTISRDILQLNNLIRAKTAEKIKQEYPWMHLCQLHSSITLENPQDVVEPINKTAAATLDFILKQLDKPVLTPEFTHLLQELIRSKPDYQEADILNLIQTLNSVLSKCSPQLLERVCKRERNRYLAGKGGDEYESLL